MAAALTLAVLIVVFFVALNVVHKKRMRALAAERAGESICQFARSLPYRQLDTTVIRAVYEEFEEAVGYPGCVIPIRASDLYEETLLMDSEDVDDMVQDIAKRCGRSLDGSEANPYHGRVHTVGEIVHFLCAQPRQTVQS
jgi:hypothetical protein